MPTETAKPDGDPREPRSRGRTLRAVATFVVLMVVFYAFIHSPGTSDAAFRPYLRLLAQVVGSTLRLVGYDVTVADTTVLYPEFSMEIVRGCDAIEPLATYAAAVLASPARLWLKVPGIFAGAAAIMLVNLVRLVSLFLVGLYYPEKFNLVHEGVWQAAFVALAIVFWFIWIQWATRERRPTPSAAPVATT